MTIEDDKNLEKMLFDFCRNDTKIPDYVDKAVEDALNRCHKKSISLIYKLRRVAIIIICIGLIATGSVFAINYLISLFANSTPGIDSAVENGFVQNIDMDFVYNNEIGIKVNNLLMDDTTLDISLVYDCPNYRNINKINIIGYTIKDEKDNLIVEINKHNSSYERNLDSIATEFTDDKDSTIINNNYYNNSFLLKSDKFPDSQKLCFDINTILINDGKTNYYIEGEWNFEIKINDELDSTLNNMNFAIDSNYINSVENYLNETTFIVDVELNDLIDKNIIHEINNVILKDENNKIYEITSITTLDNRLHIEFDYGKYNLNQKLNLYIKFAEDKEISIELN